jgi:hypothetical protein
VQVVPEVVRKLGIRTHGEEILRPRVEQWRHARVERVDELRQPVLPRPDVASFGQPAEAIEHLPLEEHPRGIGTEDVIQLRTGAGAQGVGGEGEDVDAEESLREVVPKALRTPPTVSAPEAEGGARHDVGVTDEHLVQDPQLRQSGHRW